MLLLKLHCFDVICLHSGSDSILVSKNILWRGYLDGVLQLVIILFILLYQGFPFCKATPLELRSGDGRIVLDNG